MKNAVKSVACALAIGWPLGASAQAPEAVEQAREAAEGAAEQAEAAAESAEGAEAAVERAEAAVERAEAAAEATDGEAEAPEGDAEEVVEDEGEGEGATEVILVTGSRIGRDNLEEFGHIAVIDASDIAVSGVSTLDELLRKLPSVTLQGINKNNNNGGNGLSFVDLRNLGVQRTLVLVNGRRFVTNGTGVSEAVDLNNIPLAMVERVEVLLDGASAVYGSDAIGGVVNIILKRDFEGARVDLFGGITTHGDGEEIGASLTLGHTFERGNITTNFSFMRRGRIEQSDRGWAREPVVDFIDANTPIIGSGAPIYGREVAYTGLYFNPDDPSATGEFAPYGLEDRYNYGEAQWLSGETQRFAMTTTAYYEIVDEAELFLEMTYTNRDSRTRLAPQPIGLGGTATFANGFQVPWSNPYVPEGFNETVRNAAYEGTLDALADAVAAGDLTQAEAEMQAMAAAEAAGTNPILMARRMKDVGDRITDIESDTFRVVTGLRGDLFDEAMQWELFVNYGRNESNQVIRNSVNLARAHEAADPALCSANAHRGCVVGDFFGSQLQPEVLDYIRFTDVEVTGYDHFSTGLSVAGDIVELWAGALGGALGGEFRREAGFNMPGAVTVGGDSAGNGIGLTEGDYTVGAVFGELSLPLLTNLPGVEDLTVDFAARFSDYSTFGSDVTTRVALSYAPTQDLRLRGVYSSAFRAPTITDLYGGAADSYETLTDPCNEWATSDLPQAVKDRCEAQGVPGNYNQNNAGGSQMRTNIGGNEDLGAESATVMNLGVVLTPKFAPILEGFSATVDYYRIEITEAIANPQPQEILRRCYEEGSASDCERITRNPTTFVVNELIASAQNIGLVETSGLDITIDYVLDLGLVGAPGAGRIELGWHGNYLMQYDETIEGAKIEYAGKITSNAGTFAHWRWLARLAYGLDDFTASVIFRYIGGADVLDAPEDAVYPTIDPVSYIDAAVEYRYEGLGIIVGAQNVLDTDPPFFMEGGQNANPESYDFTGRFVFTRLSYDF